ncbi:hypothetical protein Tco_0638591 [Tanacetum coccineum]
MKKRMWNMLWQVPIPKSNMYAINDKLSPEDATDDYEGCLKQLVYESNHGGAAVTQRRGNRWTLPAASSSRHLGGDNLVVETGDGKCSLMGKNNTSKYTSGGMVAYVLGQLQNKAATYALSRVRKYVNGHLTVTHEAVEALEKAS